MPRLFVGLELPEIVSAKLSTLRWGLAGARWVDPCDYHLTLCFIGDVNRHQMAEIHANLVNIKTQDFSLSIKGLNVFGGNKPHTIFAEVELSDALKALQSSCERVLRNLSLTLDSRKFVPHITLARLRESSSLDVATYLEHHQVLDYPAVKLDHFSLFSARDKFGGGPYLAEAYYPFSSAARLSSSFDFFKNYTARFAS